MSARGLEVFRNTLEKTHIWLRELTAELGWEDERKAYVALRAVLHALRDRLTVEECAHLAAQLPMLVRGLYYEGWDPTGKPLRERSREAFLAPVKEAFKGDEAVLPETVARAVFRLLGRHISHGEVEHVRHALPAEVRTLWS